jgi:hypothetical protein
MIIIIIATNYVYVRHYCCVAAADFQALPLHSRKLDVSDVSRQMHGMALIHMSIRGQASKSYLKWIQRGRSYRCVDLLLAARNNRYCFLNPSSVDVR